jgi:hypothetical protein
MFPRVQVCCPVCKLQGDDCPLYTETHNTNLSKDKTLFPIWGHGGIPTWAVVMKYKCESCKSTMYSNDGRLLSSLPAHVRAAYPVEPKYASGTFHFHRDLTSDLELLLRTYANARFVSNKLYRKLGQQYTTVVDTYLSKNCTSKFPSFEDWSGSVIPPSDTTIRDLFKRAANSSMNQYGYSDVARASREIQSVQVKTGDTVAYDWTFATLSNYHNSTAKAVFTGNKGSTHEIILLALVPSTSVSDVAHLLKQAILRREHFKPSVLYTDTCPHNSKFFAYLHGAGLVHRLGLFHLLQRMIETYDKRSEDYWRAVVQTQEAIYTYRDEPHAALLKALKDGSFSADNKRYTAEEINAMRHSKVWKQRYQQYLPKITLPANIIEQKLKRLIKEFSGKRDSKGIAVFTPMSEKAILEQCKKVHNAADPEDFELYKKIPPTKKSKHGLCKWASLRAEPALEQYHEALAHFANTNSASELTDTLNVEGTAEWNVKCRFKEATNDKKLNGEKMLVPVHFEDQPRYWDHSLLAYLNAKAEQKGLGPIFDLVTKINRDNGETFVSTYYNEQVVRNRNKQSDKKTKLCTCRDCQSPVASTIAAAARLPTPTRKRPPLSVQPAVQENFDNVSTAVVTRQNNTTTQTMAPTNTANNNQHVPVAPTPLQAAEQRPLPPAMARPPLSTAAMQAGFGYCCWKYEKYVNEKLLRGVKKSGRPPHDRTCPGKVLPPPPSATYGLVVCNLTGHQAGFGFL